jgi:hypothetical protein
MVGRRLLSQPVFPTWAIHAPTILQQNLSLCGQRQQESTDAAVWMATTGTSMMMRVKQMTMVMQMLFVVKSHASKLHHKSIACRDPVARAEQ